jgi:hypothetical protein
MSMMEQTNLLLEELLRTIRFSNKILMMVNLVNIATILVILVMIT